MKLKKSYCGVIGVAFLAIACGKSPAGTYSISQILQGGSLAANCQNSQLNLNISDNGNTITGSGSNSCFSNEQLTGTDDGNGHLNNVTLVLTLANTQGSYGQNPYQYPYQQYPYGSGYPQPQPQPQPQSQAVTCTYYGSLNFSNRQISGTLNQQQGGQQQSYYSYNGSCPTSITINGSMN